MRYLILVVGFYVFGFSSLIFSQVNPKSNFKNDEKQSNKFGPAVCKECKLLGYQAVIKEIKDDLKNSIKIKRLDFTIAYNIGGDYKKAEHEICGNVILKFKKVESIYFHIGFIEGTETIWNGVNNLEENKQTEKVADGFLGWVSTEVCFRVTAHQGRGKLVLQFFKHGGLLESYFVWKVNKKSDKVMFWLTPGIDHNVKLKWDNVWGGLEIKDF